MIKKIIIFVLLALPMVVQSQSRKVWINNADNFYEKEDFHNALINYKLALSDSSGLSMMVLPYEVDITKQKLSEKGKEIDTARQVPLRDYLEHQIASCYLQTYDYKKAVEQFEKTSTFESYPEDVYHFAVAQMNVDQHENAIVNFERYISSDHYNDSLLRSAQLSVTGCKYAMNSENVKEKVAVWRADTNVFNKGSSSFATMFFGSEEKILFTSARDGGVILDPEKQDSKFILDLYWTQKSGENDWSEAKNFGRPLNTAQHDASGTLSKNDIIYYTRWSDADRKDKNIYLARMVNLKFYESFKLPEAVNVPGYKSVNPFVTKSGKWLYFSSNRPGGEGGMDIWKIELNESGNVINDAINLGRPINSELNEVTPFYHQVSSTLFFSSNGHNSIGGLDIYKASYNRRNKAFDDPINLGMPINSSKDDAYLIWDDNLKNGFFSSDREPCENGHCYDIYQVSNEPIIITLSGYAFNGETDEVLPNTNLAFKDIDFVFETFDLKTDEDGFYSIELTQNQEIFIKATRPSFFADAASVNTKSITESTKLTQDFFLNPIPTGEIEIEGIEYDFDKATLRPSSKEILDKLVEFLELNNNLVIEINSHTDARGSDKYNQRLSQRRAKSCVDYLIKSGISKTRLKAIGYGESEPNVLKGANKKPVLDDKGKRIYLTEDVIKAAESEELREEYHQRNRRTSFKVVGEGFNLESN
ncbi:MAG: OmpA family protein [Fluviicola sp.]|nr:OmpA family protein [Fluviicola sp.]